MIASTLTRVAQILDDEGAVWMVVGSVAATFHGLSRSTVDLDIVVQLDSQSVRGLVARFEASGFYVSEAAALDATRRRGMFNAIDMETGWKADIILRKARPHGLAELARRARAPVLGVSAWVASAEDVLLAKLEWAQASESERQLRDVAALVAAQGDSLDERYVEHWAAELGVLDLWRQVRAVARPPS